MASSLRPELKPVLEQHCRVIDFTDWSRLEKERIKKRIRKILISDGNVDYRAFPTAYRWNLCSARLMHGDFTNWDGWEFRSPWFITFMGAHGEKCPIPRFDGNQHEHIVVLGEQGIGDELLFLSALPDLMVRYGKKTLEVVLYPFLRSIVERSFGVKTSDRRLLGEITAGDCVLASGDLFQWYRRDISHFPRKPFLKPDPEKVGFWQNWLKQYGDRPKIGVAWYSRHGFIDPEDLKTVKDAVYFDLQYRNHEKPLPDVTCNLEPALFSGNDRFDDLFAFVAALDSVHSVTQTLVHVAGAIGKTCHAVIPPKNGEVAWYLWYHECNKLGSTSHWPHLVYGSVTTYRDIHEFRDRGPR